MLYSVKGCGLQLKDVDTERGTVSGYFSAFDIQDSDEDILTKGAFAKTIAERGPASAHPRIKHLLDHDTTKAPAVIQALDEDAVGLAYVSKTGRHTLGRDYLLMCQDGIITEHSFGFDVVKSIPNPNSQSGYGRIITEVKMWEGSGLQAWGANPFTPLTGAKSLTESERTSMLVTLSDRLNKLTKALRGAYSDDLCALMEIQAAQIEALCKSLTSAPAVSLESESEPALVTPPAVEPNGSELASLFKSKLSFLN